MGGRWVGQFQRKHTFITEHAAEIR
jgi:hypothetical protein